MFIKLLKFGNTLQKKINQFVKTVGLYCRNQFHNNIKNKKIEPVTTELIHGNAMKNSSLSKPQEMYCPSSRIPFFLCPGILCLGSDLYSLYRRDFVSFQPMRDKSFSPMQQHWKEQKMKIIVVVTDIAEGM